MENFTQFWDINTPQRRIFCAMFDEIFSVCGEFHEMLTIKIGGFARKVLDSWGFATEAHFPPNVSALLSANLNTSDTNPFSKSDHHAELVGAGNSHELGEGAKSFNAFVFCPSCF